LRRLAFCRLPFLPSSTAALVFFPHCPRPKCQAAADIPFFAKIRFTYALWNLCKEYFLFGT
jgi:hypothetical protein